MKSTPEDAQSSDEIFLRLWARRVKQVALNVMAPEPILDSLFFRFSSRSSLFGCSAVTRLAFVDPDGPLPLEIRWPAPQKRSPIAMRAVNYVDYLQIKQKRY